MEQLDKLGFGYVGAWRTPECRVHQAAWIKHKRGIYAFVVDGSIKYIGKTDDALHRRLRNYSRRCFRPTGSRRLRPAHAGIVRTIAETGTVHVYALIPDAAILATDLEGDLIRQFQPSWNRTHGAGGRSRELDL
jgi:hypothetical protein